MRLYVTSHGIARQRGDELDILDVPCTDIGDLLEYGLDSAAASSVRETVPLSGAQLLAPIQRPHRMFLTGINYLSHAAEIGGSAPERPPVLPIADHSSIAAPHADIVLPAEAPAHVDYEGELAVVIGRAGRDIPAGRGWQHVGGYAVVNDVSARDIQMSAIKDGKVTDPDTVARSKTFPTFKPIGPCVTTPEELGNISVLALQTRVNGTVRQRATLGDMIFDVAAIIETISQTVELTVGDLIFTGTPGGVGFIEGRYLQQGDVIEVSIDGIGLIRNAVVAN